MNEGEAMNMNAILVPVSEIAHVSVSVQLTAPVCGTLFLLSFFETVEEHYFSSSGHLHSVGHGWKGYRLVRGYHVAHPREGVKLVGQPNTTATFKAPSHNDPRFKEYFLQFVPLGDELPVFEPVKALTEFVREKMDPDTFGVRPHQMRPFAPVIIPSIDVLGPAFQASTTVTLREDLTAVCVTTVPTTIDATYMDPELDNLTHPVRYSCYASRNPRFLYFTLEFVGSSLGDKKSRRLICDFHNLFPTSGDTLEKYTRGTFGSQTSGGGFSNRRGDMFGDGVLELGRNHFVSCTFDYLISDPRHHLSSPSLLLARLILINNNILSVKSLGEADLTVSHLKDAVLGEPLKLVLPCDDNSENTITIRITCSSENFAGKMDVAYIEPVIAGAGERVVSFTVKKIVGLPKADLLFTCDAFVIIKGFKSKVVKCDDDYISIFNQEFRFSHSPHAPLEVELYDRDQKKDELLGTVAIHLQPGEQQANFTLKGRLKPRRASACTLFYEIRVE